MKIYNTLTRRKEEFVPLTPGQVKMYVCGPTVYNLIHIGNARPMMVFDTVRRYMEYKGLTVNYVSNFTDVDDKIINKALAEKVDATVISERYIDECQKDMAAMNVRPATAHPKATEEIDGMLQMIARLIEQGYAYVASDGTVYFRTARFKEYGKLSGKNLAELQGGNRTLLVTGADQKEDPLDFVLWKPRKAGEPFWASPWCDGRPGWHIECSVMSKKYLGEEIDIHAGGEDLIFPHHENEIAQSEAANGKPFAKYWMHNAFLNIDNRKMSKSAGNFFTVREIAAQYDLQILRFFMLSAHYRSPLNFSAELMAAAAASYERIVNCVAKLHFLIEKNSDKTAEAGDRRLTGRRPPTAAADPAADKAAEVTAAVQSYTARFEEAMDDDFNTADAIAVIFELVKYANSVTGGAADAGGDGGAGVSRPGLGLMKEAIVRLADICGLTVEKKTGDLTAGIEDLLAQRQAARADKNFARADEIRNELLKMGIILEDTREGVKWKRA